MMMQDQHITIGKQLRFTLFYKSWSQGWPFLLTIPLVAGAIVSLITFASWIKPQFTPLTAIVLLAAFGLSLIAVLFACMLLSTILLPALGQFPRVESWFRDVRADAARKGIPFFVVDLILKPRAVTGIAAFFDDADDVGLLTIDQGGLRFQGDSIQMWIVADNVASLRVKRMGWRGAWIAGKDCHIEFAKAVDDRTGFMVRIREGRTIFHTRRRSRELVAALESSCARTGDG